MYPLSSIIVLNNGLAPAVRHATNNADFYHLIQTPLNWCNKNENTACCCTSKIVLEMWSLACGNKLDSILLYHSSK